MRPRRRIIAALAAFAAALGSALPTLAAAPALGTARRPGAASPHAPGRVLVKIDPSSTPSVILRQAGLRDLGPVQGVAGWRAAAPGLGISPRRAAATLRLLRGVTAAEPDFVASATAEPDDPCLSRACPLVEQWNMYAISASPAWEKFPGRTYTAATKPVSSPVLVAVLDTTIDLNHPDFVNSQGQATDITEGGQLDTIAARSWVEPGKQTGQSAYHGTYVAGILAAATGNGIDIASIGYNSVLLPLAVLDGSGATTASKLAEAIAYAKAYGARVLNLSLGMESDSQIVHDAIKAATSGDEPALIVAAAGNNTKDRPFYPASYPEVMSVSGFDSSRSFAPCSNYNQNVSVSAPARHVMSLAPMPERKRVVDCGTSAAAPHVSGLASLLWGQDPARTAAQIRSIIESTADDDAVTPGRDPRFGFGLINAERALHASSTGPQIDQVASTIATRGGNESTVTAIARSSLPITSAEAFLDRPGHAPARIPMQPADGAWGGTLEHLRAVVAIPDGTQSASHTLYVRARNVDWGPSARGVLAIDRSAPEIVNVRAPNAIRGQKATISFVIRDAYSKRFGYRAAVFGPDGAPVWTSPYVSGGAGAKDLYWTPTLVTLPGPHRIEIFVWDEAGNPAAASAQTVIL